MFETSTRMHGKCVITVDWKIFAQLEQTYDVKLLINVFENRFKMV